jgi:hypothetical protein
MGYDIIFSMLKLLTAKVWNIFLALFNSSNNRFIKFNCTLFGIIPLFFKKTMNHFLPQKKKSLKVNNIIIVS